MCAQGRHIIRGVDTRLNKIAENIFPVKKVNSGWLDTTWFKCGLIRICVI